MLVYVMYSHTILSFSLYEPMFAKQNKVQQLHMFYVCFVSKAPGFVRYRDFDMKLFTLPTHT